MTRIPVALFIAALSAAAPAGAVDLFDAEGRWVGTGSLATKVTRPMQPARCEVTAEQKADATDISVTGRCAVGGGGSSISFRAIRDRSGGVRGAMWAAANGETIQMSGTEASGVVDMLATAPWVVDGVSYETRVTVSEPDATSFAIRQMVRGPDETAWRVIVDMTYRQP